MLGAVVRAKTEAMPKIRRKIEWTLAAGFVLLVTLALGMTAKRGAVGSDAPVGMPPDEPKKSEVRPVPIQDALQKPFMLPFAKPTSLETVAAYLHKNLHVEVVLDRAALGRLDIKPDETVQIELADVRLKTGLKLLLDQVGMTFRIEPEDNLLILTDSTGADDPIERVLAEIKAASRRSRRAGCTRRDPVRPGLDDIDGPKIRKPTIIEEMPAKPGEKPQDLPDPPRPKTHRSGI